MPAAIVGLPELGRDTPEPKMNEADKRLELGIFPVTDVRLGSATGYDDGVVTVDADGLRDALLEDIRLDDVQFDVIHPGDMVRVTTVRDQVEPRIKVKWPGRRISRT